MPTILRRLAFPLLLLFAAAAAEAQEAGWQRYVDPVFGTRIDYPAFLFAPAEGIATGVIFTGPEARLEVSAITMPGVTTADDIRELIVAGFGYDNVTYSPQGRTWLVLSGYRGGNVFYEKFFAVNGTVQGFSFEYPVESRSFFDPMVEMLEDSFRPG